MKFVPLTPEVSDAWDAVVAQSDDGWMCSLSRWQKMIASVPPWAGEDVSFAVMDADEMVAVMPLQLTADARLCSTMMGPSGPVVRSSVTESARREILQAICERLRGLARETGARQIEMQLSPLSRASLSRPTGSNFLVDHGFEDISTHSWVVDLRCPREKLERNISRNARREVKEALAKGYRVRPLTGRREMDLYYEIHQETYHRTGAHPHPKEYFLGIHDYFTAEGLSRIWVAIDSQETPVGFTNIAVYRNTALYWTTCCRDKAYANGVYYLLLWHAILAAKDEGLEWFDCAEAFPDAPAGSKTRGLSDFKRKFGGALHRYFKGRLRLVSDEANRQPTAVQVVRERLRAANRVVERALGKRAAAVIAFPARAGLQALRTLKRRIHPPVSYLKPDWFDSERNSGARPETAALEIFERAFRDKLRIASDACLISTGSGRTAFEVALRVLRAKFPGRTRVVIPSYGCRGTFDPIVRCGLVPVFADVNNDLLTDDAELERHFGPETLAVLLVHLGGKRLEVGRILERAAGAGVAAIEDHCQNVGGERPADPLADLRIYAFGMGKNIMAGAGGALVARVFQDEFKREGAKLQDENPSVARERFRSYDLRCFHPERFEKREAAGLPQGNCLSQYGYVRMSAVDAAVLVEQLKRLDAIIDCRRRNAARIIRCLAEFPGLFAFQPSQNHIYTKLSIRLATRRLMRDFVSFMMRQGIELEPMYVPLHLRAFGTEFRREPLPNSERIYPRVINLPARPNLAERDLQRITRAIEEFGRAHV